MDEKELSKKIKNSFKKGMSRVEITKKLQEQGYKLEYIDLMINKATKVKKIFIWIFVVLLVSAAFTLATLGGSEEQSFFNPLEGKMVDYGETERDSSGPISSDGSGNSGSDKISIDEIEITPDLISYLLQEIGTGDLHKNYLSGEKAIINFKIDDREFSSIIDKKIETSKGLSGDADVVFISDKKSMVKALTADDVDAEVKKRVEGGDIQMEVLASESELFSKGYLSLYNSLK